jgi:uncharacterized protein
MAHPNEDLVRRGYAAFRAGDLATLGELFADDVVFHIGGRGRLSGDYAGKQAVFDYFGQLAQETGGTFSLEIHDVLANDVHVVALNTTSAQREGRSLNDVPNVQVFHVQDGTVTESWIHSGDQYASDEFYA